MSILVGRLVPGAALAWLALAPVAAWAASGDASQVAMGQLLKVLIGLGVVVVGIFALSRLLGRLQGTRGGDAGLGIVAVRPLGQRERLVVVAAGDRQLLLGVTASQISLLLELDAPLAASGGEPGAAGPSWLSRVLGRETG